MILLNAPDRWYIITFLSLFHWIPTFWPLHCFFSSRFPFTKTHSSFLERAIIYLVYFIIYFNLLFNCTCCVIGTESPYLWGWMHPDSVMMKWPTRDTISGNMLQKRRAKGHRSDQSERCIPITPARSPLSRTARPSFTTTNTSEIHWSYSQSLSVEKWS